MKIGYITPSVSRAAGGIFEIVKSYAHLINSLPNTKVSVFGLKDRFTSQDLPSWSPLQLHLFSVYGPSSFGFAPGLTNALIKSDIGLCHLHILWMYTSIATLMWKHWKNKPFIISAHGLLESWALKNSQWKKRIAATFYERRCLQAASCIHVFTNAEYESIRKFNLKNPVCIIPSGIKLPSNDYTHTLPPWRKQKGTAGKVLLYLGRIHPKKGLINLLLAWQKVGKCSGRARDWNLVIAGWDQNGHEFDLRQLVKNLDIGSSVHFIGPQFNEEKQKCFFHADAFVLPSYSEGLPVVVLEAWSYKLPVLITPECHLPEGYVTGSALKIEPDADSIASSLKLMFEMSDHQLSEIGQKGRKLVEEKFTLEHSASRMYKVYEWMSGENAVPETMIF